MTSWNVLLGHRRAHVSADVTSLDRPRDIEIMPAAPRPARSARSHRRAVDPVLLWITAGAGVIRFVALGSQSMWFDEVHTTEVISGGITGLWGRVRDTESAPPLYFALAWLWTKLFGDGDATIRSLSALAGVATVPVVYLIARELGQDRRTARIAALLVAVHPFLVWYSQEARPYALFVCFGAVSLLGFLRSMGRGAPSDLVMFGVASAAALATHYFAIFLIAPECLVLVAARARDWRRLLIPLLPLAVAIAVLYPLAVRQRSIGTQRWVRGWLLRIRESETSRHFLVGLGVESRAMWRIAGVVVLVAAGLLLLRTDRPQRLAASLMLLLGAAVVFVPLFFVSDFYLDRNVIVALVPLIVAVAIGLGAERAAARADLRTRWIGPAAVVCAVSVSLAAIIAVASDPHRQRTDWRSIAHVIEQQPNDRVVVMTKDSVLGTGMRRYFRNSRVLDPSETVTVREVDVLNLVVGTRHCDFWFGRTCQVSGLGEQLPFEYLTHFVLAERPRVQDFRIDRYTSGPQNVQAGRLVDPAVHPDPLMLFVPAR